MDKNFGQLPIFLLVVLWATYGPLLRFFEAIDVNPIDLNFLSFATGTVLFFVFFRLKKIKIGLPGKNEAKKFAVYAVSLLSTNLFLFYAFTKTTLANTIVLHYTALFWASIAAVFLFNEKPTRWKIVSFALAVAGIAVIFFPGISLSQEYLEGNLFALASSFGYAGIILASRSLKNTEQKKASFYAMFFSAILSAPLFLVFGSIKNFTQLASIVSFGAFYNTAESVMLIYGMSSVSVIAAGLILVLEIPLTALFGVVLFSESISVNTIAGGLLIMAGTVILITKEKTSKA